MAWQLQQSKVGRACGGQRVNFLRVILICSTTTTLLPDFIIGQTNIPPKSACIINKNGHKARAIMFTNVQL